MAAGSISILGCGWLGLPLGKRLVERGYQVRGSTTSRDKVRALEDAGIEPHLLELTPELRGELGDFFDCEVLFLNVPPRRRRDDVLNRHPREIEAVREALRHASASLVIFASSTSVYRKANTVVTEDDAGQPESASGQALLKAETLLQDADDFDTTILRFGGLYGYDRQPGRFLAGRDEIPDGDAPVNLVHRDDCVDIVEAVIERDVRGEVFNVCADGHPTRRALYVQAAKRMGLDPPTFADDETTHFKVVSNEKLKARLAYRFRHPDPMEETP